MMTGSLSFAAFQRLVPDPGALVEALRSRCLVLPTTGSADALLEAALVDPDAAQRARDPHITVSAILFDAQQDQVALLLHRKRGQWFYPGGHADGDWNWCGAAIRECHEELAPADLELGIEGSDVWVDAAGKGGGRDPAHQLILPRLVVRHDAVDHEHIDFVYILRTADLALAVAPDEGERCGWFTLRSMALASPPDPLLTDVTCQVITAAAKDLPRLQWFGAGSLGGEGEAGRLTNDALTC